MVEHSIEVVVDEMIVGGRSVLTACIFEEGVQRGKRIELDRSATPKDIAGKIMHKGIEYSRNVIYPPFGDIYLAASKKVPGL